MSAIFRREFRSYFTSMIGYVFIAVILAFVGVYFTVTNLASGYPYFSYTLAQTLQFFLFCIPLLTMRSMAEDRKSRTDQMLLTYPVSVVKVVLGKYFAMVAVLAIPMIIFCVYPLILRAYGAHGTVSDYSTILAVFLLGCMFLAIGMFISSLTENQIIAAVAAFFVLLVLFMWDDLISFLPAGIPGNMLGCLILVAALALFLYFMSRSAIPSMVVAIIGFVAVIVLYFVDSSRFAGLLSTLLGKLSIMTVLNNFAFTFVFDWPGLIFYVSVAVLFLFLTVQTVQKRRWV